MYKREMSLRMDGGWGKQLPVSLYPIFDEITIGGIYKDSIPYIQISFPLCESFLLGDISIQSKDTLLGEAVKEDIFSLIKQASRTISDPYNGIEAQRAIVTVLENERYKCEYSDGIKGFLEL